MRIFQLIPHRFAHRRVLGLTVRAWIPVLVLVLLVAGIFSPLFDLTQIHGVAGPKLYFQHAYFDAIAGLGGYWAATFCEHTWHRILLMVTIDALTTFALVTLIG
jgi:hypothetical protein